MTTTEYRSHGEVMVSSDTHNIYLFDTTPKHRPKWTSTTKFTRMSTIHNFDRTVETWYGESTIVVIVPTGEASHMFERTGETHAVIVLHDEHDKAVQLAATKASMLIAVNVMENLPSLFDFESTPADGSWTATREA